MKKAPKGLGLLRGTVDDAINSGSNVSDESDSSPTVSDKPESASDSKTSQSTSSIVSTLNKTKKNTADKNKAVKNPPSSTGNKTESSLTSRERVGIVKKYEGDVVKTTIMMPSAVHDVLVDICHHNRKTSKETLNDLYLQGLDAVLLRYGQGSIDKIVERAEKLEIA